MKLIIHPHATCFDLIFVVSHNKRGIEVVSLTTGAPIVAMALTEGQTYVDVDGDGIVDSVLLLENDDDVAVHAAYAVDRTKSRHCSMMVVSGLPPRAQLFNGTICEGRPSMHDSLSRSAKKAVPDISAASPLILRNINPHSGTESKEKDIVVAVNTGIITCYSGKGVFKWQMKDTPTWTRGNRNVSAVLFDADSTRVDDLGKHDNVHAQILVVGEDRMSLISREGAELASAFLPKPPLSKPIIGDFDSDGVSDIIILTSDAFLGFKVEVTSSPNGLFIAMLILILAAITIFFLSLKSEIITVDGTRHENSNKRVFTLIRSTDEQIHLD